MRWNEYDFLAVGRVWAVMPGSLYGMAAAATVMGCPRSPRFQLLALPCVVGSP